MRNIYEPADVGALEAETGTIPNVEITDGLRLHFYADGVTFGLVDPRDSRFAAIIPYSEARRLMEQAAHATVCKCGHKVRFHDNEAASCDVQGCGCELLDYA
jgi:hypothetical protein